MKVKQLLIWFLVPAVLLVGLRTVEQALFISDDSGFYKSGYEIAGYAVLGITLAAMLLMLIFGSTRKRYPVSVPIKSKPLFIMSLVMAAAIVIDIFMVMLSEEFSSAVVLSASKGLLFYLYLFYIAFAVLSLLFFLYYAYAQWQGIRPAGFAPVAVIIMTVLKLAIVFTEHSGIANISDNINNTAMICFLLAFWLFHGRMIADAGYPKAVKWAYGFGMCAAVYCLVCTLPYYFIKLTGNGSLLHQTELPSLLLIASAIYIIVFLYASLASGTEDITIIKKRYDDESKKDEEDSEKSLQNVDDNISKADEIYNEIIKSQNRSSDK